MKSLISEFHRSDMPPNFMERLMESLVEKREGAECNCFRVVCGNSRWRDRWGRSCRDLETTETDSSEVGHTSSKLGSATCHTLKQNIEQFKLHAECFHNEHFVV